MCPSALVTCHVNELLRHPAYVWLDLAVTSAQLSAIEELGDLAFKDPLLITRDRVIIDGYARWELAKKQGILRLPCIEFDIDEEEALRRILKRHRRSYGWNDYNRICMASELKVSTRRKAQVNQRTGGQIKGSSKLTEAEKVDVRREVAKAAGVSVGNVAKVDQLRRNAHPEILQALHSGEVRIHRAWKWSTMAPEQQRNQLRIYRLERGLKKTARALISRQRAESLPPTSDVRSLSVGDLNALASEISSMSASGSGESDPIIISSIDVPGRVVFLTEELFRAVATQQEENPACLVNIR
jgi:hypothetical protein